MSFNIVPKLSFTASLHISSSLYFHEPHYRLDGQLFDSEEASKALHLLPIPENLKKEILCVIFPVGEQISAWYRDFRCHHNRHTDLNGLICWTPLGTIDYGRTATNCISSGQWRDSDCFVMACSGSDPEAVHRLWPVAKTEILDEIAENGLKVENPKWRVRLWIKFWVAYLTDQMDTFKRLNNLGDFADDEYFFVKLAVKYNNVGAARYFLGKIKNKCGLNQLILSLTKECILLHRRKFDPSIFIFLVSHLNEEQVKMLLNDCKTDLLVQILKWPLHQFVIPMSEFMWFDSNFESDLERLLEMVLFKIMQTPVPIEYEEIFKTLWSKTSPGHHREYFFRHTKLILNFLFTNVPIENVIQALFKDSSNAFEKFLQEFLPNASAVLRLSFEENKFTAFKNILQQLFPKEAFVDDFENVYAQYTQVYIDVYYGNNLSSDTDYFSDTSI